MSPQPLKGKRLSDINLKFRLLGGMSINASTIARPLIALTMAGLLFVYARSSVRAAKRNAEQHRNVDGGQINWYVYLNEVVHGSFRTIFPLWLHIKRFNNPSQQCTRKIHC